MLIRTWLGRAIALYIIQPTNLAPAFQGRNFVRCGVAGSRETQNIDRSATPSGAESKASSLYSRAAMYFGNWIAGGRILAALVLPRTRRNRNAEERKARMLRLYAHPVPDPVVCRLYGTHRAMTRATVARSSTSSTQSSTQATPIDAVTHVAVTRTVTRARRSITRQCSLYTDQ